MTTRVHDEATRQAVEAFLFREARLLDEHEYAAWLDLWAEDDVRYWVPGDEADVDPARAISIIYDDRKQLEDRIFRLQHPAAHAFNPPPRLARLVSNVEVHDADGEIVTDSAYMLVVSRHQEQDIFGARVRHTLRRTDSGFQLREKKVVLTAAGAPLRNLTFLP